jgi:hypothetical protein
MEATWGGEATWGEGMESAAAVRGREERETEKLTGTNGCGTVWLRGLALHNAFRGWFARYVGRLVDF